MQPFCQPKLENVQSAWRRARLVTHRNIWRSLKTMVTPTRDAFSFGMQVSRRGNTFREGTNPFTGEVVRFYANEATADEVAALEETLERYDIEFDAVEMSNFGEIEGTSICIPHVNLSDGSFGGATVELVGEVISDESIEAVLEMGRSASLFFENSIGKGALAAPTVEVLSKVQSFSNEEVLLVDTAEQMRSWLLEHVGAQKVI